MPEKPYEQKTSEEKLLTMAQINANFKSSGAKSIMKQPGGKKNKKPISFGQCQVYEYDKDLTKNEVAKKVDAQDISDMRDEKTKMKALLQEKENEQLRAFQKAQAAMAAYVGDDNKFRSSATEARGDGQAVDVSGSLSQSKDRDRARESYDTDTFEEQSASQSKSQSADGSGQKNIAYWPGKDAFQDSADASASVSKSKETGGVLSAAAMDEYLAKQAAKKAGAEAAKPATKPKDISESSERYSDEFDSYSKSQSAIGLDRHLPGGRKDVSSSGVGESASGSLGKAAKRRGDVDPRTSHTSDRYANLTAHQALPTSAKEKFLERKQDELRQQLADREHALVLEQGDMNALRERVKRLEMDLRTQRRELLHANATNDCVNEPLKK